MNITKTKNQTLMINKQINRGDFSANSSPPLQKLITRILKKEKKKVYKKNEFYGNSYLKLQTVSEESKERKIFVYRNITGMKIANDIAKNARINNWYLFFCRKKGRRWILHNWQELGNNLNSKPETILRNHE